MAKKKDDVFIAALKYMRQQTIEGRELGNYDMGVDHIHAAYSTIDKEFIRYLFDQACVGRRNLNPDAYFQLMEHEELNEARQSSSRAFKVAIGALSISSVIGIASIITSIVVAVQK